LNAPQALCIAAIRNKISLITYLGKLGIQITERLEFPRDYKGDIFVVVHTSSADVPTIMSGIEVRWMQALNSRKNISGRLRAIAEMEWIYYWTNPFGRGGALTRRVLSLALQKAISEKNNFQVEDAFDYYDQHALTMQFSDYVEFRIDQLKKRLH
jgi:hypothetical protein